MQQRGQLSRLVQEREPPLQVFLQSRCRQIVEHQLDAQPLALQLVRDGAQRAPAEGFGVDAPHDRRRQGVDVVPALGVVGPAVAIERARARQGLAAQDPRPLGALRPLRNLGVLDLGGIAADEANELALGAVIERFRTNSTRTPGCSASLRSMPRWTGSRASRSMA